MKKIVVAKDLTKLFPEMDSFLDRAEVAVFPAVTNEEIRSICAQERVDLIVSHLDLPGVKSEGLFHSIRSSDRLRKVSIIIVIQDTPAQRKRCEQCGANAVLTLPVDINELFMKMLQFLNIAPRMTYRASLAVAFEGKFRNRPLPFWTENISASGMLIRSEEPLAMHATVFLSFFLPDGGHVSGYGEIVRVEHMTASPEQFLYGIKFTKMDPVDRAAIEKAVQVRQSRNAQ